jgi:hypothetical protein
LKRTAVPTGDPDALTEQLSAACAAVGAKMAPTIDGITTAQITAKHLRQYMPNP